MLMLADRHATQTERTLRKLRRPKDADD